MYHVIGTSLIFSLLYLLSLFLSRSGFYDDAFHRKIWNSVLAVTFIFVALAGFFMALKINYKWNVPFIKELLKWHVEIGAVCTMTSLFHLSWHLNYFRRIFNKNISAPEQEYSFSIDPVIVTSGMFVTGFTSTSIQILIAREIMNISGGYELITGVFLGSWLALSAAGAAIAGRSSLFDLKKILLFFSVTPFISLMLLIVSSRYLTETGATPSFFISMVMILVVLLPFCFISGFSFIKLLSVRQKMKGISAGNSYALETAGGAAAGIIITMLASRSFSTYKLFLVIALLSLAFTLLSFFSLKKKLRFILKVLFTLIISFIIVADPDLFFRQMLMHGIKVTSTTDTPYGNITHGNYFGEPVLYYNQRLLSYGNDAMEREEDIHFAMLQRKQHARVIVLSGNIQSLLPEIDKYKASHVTFIEIDPGLVAGKINTGAGYKTDYSIQYEDAWSYIRKGKERADAIIMLIAPPSTLSLNRYYTTGFFRSVRNTLIPGGVFICSPAPGDEYLNKEAISLCSSVYNSLTSVFKYVKPIMGQKLWFIASDEEVSASFCKLSEEQGIKNVYVGPDYFSDDITEAKSIEVMRALDKSADSNTTAFPVAAMRYQSYNLSRNLTEKIPALLLALLLFAVPLTVVRRKNLLMCLSASALAGFEIICLLAIQLAAGNMYQLTGLTLALFMTGLAAGAAFKIKSSGKKLISLIALALIIIFIAAGILLIPLTELRSEKLSVAIILGASLLPSFLTGMLFTRLTGDYKGVGSVSAIYSSDLVGSALGFAAISTVAVPLIGIPGSLFILSGLIFAGLLFGTTGNK